MKRVVFPATVVLALGVTFYLFSRDPAVIDDAKKLGLRAADFPELKTDVFQGMDNDAERRLSPEEIAGRNSWNLWTGGSQVFIDWLAKHSHGISDTLRMLDSRNRDKRHEEFGLVNEPGFETAVEPGEWGLWLDVPADGSEMGRIDRMIKEEGIDERVYGRSTGVLGLRLFPNPNFDEVARKKWDPDRYYDLDDVYAMNPELERPYLVGMTCGICHIAPNPLKPPINPNRPDWENLVSALGNQYFREGRVFATNLRPPNPGHGRSSFFWEMMNAQPPGTSDTSRMATDHINNPGAINAIFNLEERLAAAARNPEAWEKQSRATQNLPGDHTNPRFVPHVLKDGADSVGVSGAILRVYVNIGMFSQQWLKLHQPLVGVKHQRPFEIALARKNSVYWRATEQRLDNITAYLMSSKPMALKDARWIDQTGADRTGGEFITRDAGVMTRGRIVFAENCAKCHSSKRPPPGAGAGWFRESVMKEDFLAGNFLSEDKRHSIGSVGTNAGRALATNAKRGRIWDNFSSETYKDLPVAVKQIQVYNPLTGKDLDYTFDLGKKGIRHSLGYYRTPSLIALWTSAPFFHNNMLGIYNGDPSVEGRLAAFQDAAEKLLWPEKRDGVNSIWRTEHESAIEIPVALLPEIVQRDLEQFPELVDRNEQGRRILRLGPIPKGTPINLLASLDMGLGGIDDARKVKSLSELALKIRMTLHHIRDSDLGPEETEAHLRKNLLPELLENSKCPDFVNDRGHEYGAELSDEDKQALIEFLKTF